MDQDHHGNEGGWIKYLWTHKGMANCAYCFGPKISNGDALVYKTVSSGRAVTRVY